jgi:Tol biopolymer transport system component
MTAWDVGWLPDGTRLYLLGSRVRGELDLYTMPLLGGEPSLVMESVLRAGASPDGESFAVIRAGAEGAGRFSSLWTVGTQGQDPRVVWEAEGTDAFWTLSWSPDSQRIAVGVGSGDAPTIRSVDPATGSTSTLIEDVRLFQSWTGVLPFAWCGDGRLIYSLIDGARIQATSNVWIIETDVESGTPRGSPRRLTQRFGSNVRGLTATTDCSTVAAMLVRNQADVWVARLADGGVALSDEVRVTSDERADHPAAWIGSDQLIVRSPMASTVDFYQWNPGSPDVTSFIRAEEHLQQGAWDSSTERFVYSREGLWVTGREGGIGTRITEGPGLELSCAYGGGCVGGRQIGSDFVFYRIDLEAGSSEEILRIDHRPPFTNFALSPDGRMAAVVHNDNNVIRLVDLSSGEETALEITGWSLFEFVSWSADGRRLFVNAGFATSGVYPVLLSVDLNGDHRVLREAPNVWHVRPLPSPDGEYLAFAAMPFQGNAFLLTDF